MKQCNKCKEWKDESEYYWRKNTNNLNRICKQCIIIQHKEYWGKNKKEMKKRNKAYYEKNKEEILLQDKEYNKRNKKIITKRCRKYYEKNREEILRKKKKYQEDHRGEIAERMKRYRKKHRGEIAERKKEQYKKNKIKIAKQHKMYYEKNKKKILERKKKNYVKNRERITEINKKSCEKNRERILERKRKYQKEHKDQQNAYKTRKRHENPKLRLEHNISSVIRQSLKGQKNGRQWESLVGFTLDDLVCHLEKQFTPEVTWDNYGSYWHLDHIIPLSYFKYETAEDTEFKMAWCLDNLQSLQKTLNFSKGNRLTLNNTLANKKNLNLLIRLMIFRDSSLKMYSDKFIKENLKQILNKKGFVYYQDAE